MDIHPLGNQSRCSWQRGGSAAVRVPDVQLVEARQGSRRAEHSTQRFVISPDLLEQIRAEMLTLDDELEVEKVLQYRTYYRQQVEGLRRPGARIATRGSLSLT